MRWGASTGWVLGAAFLLWTTWTSGSPHNSNARWAQSGESRYGMLGKAILEGRTNLGIELPKGLESLENPYLRKNNRSFSGGKLWDTAYYKGKIYIYHGVVPALLLYAPFQQITGTELNDAFALALLCLLASGASCACIRILAGNCPEGWQALAALVATIGPGYAYIIRRADMYEIAIMGGATLTAVSLLLILLGQHRKTSVWTGAAATCWALAVGCRPTAIINLGVPAAVAAKAWREGKRHLVVAGILAATIGVGLGIYNWARFERVWEFGTRYMLTGLDTGIATPAYYSAEIFKYNFPFYALNPPEWTWEFPYAVALRSWHGHAGQVIGEPLTGVVGTTPVAVLAILGAALAFKKGRNRIWWAAITLTWAPALLAVAAVIFTSMRYLLDFTPAMLTASCAVACRWLAAPRRGKYPSWRAATAATLLLLSVPTPALLSLKGYYHNFERFEPGSYNTLKTVGHAITNPIRDTLTKKTVRVRKTDGTTLGTVPSTEFPPENTVPPEQTVLHHKSFGSLGERDPRAQEWIMETTLIAPDQKNYEWRVACTGEATLSINGKPVLTTQGKPAWTQTLLGKGSHTVQLKYKTEGARTLHAYYGDENSGAAYRPIGQGGNGDTWEPPETP